MTLRINRFLEILHGAVRQGHAVRNEHISRVATRDRRSDRVRIGIFLKSVVFGYPKLVSRVSLIGYVAITSSTNDFAGMDVSIAQDGVLPRIQID